MARPGTAMEMAPLCTSLALFNGLRGALAYKGTLFLPSFSFLTFGKCSFSDIILHKNTREKFLPRSHESSILILVLEMSFSVCLSPPTGSFSTPVFSFKVLFRRVGKFLLHCGQNSVWRDFPSSYKQKLQSTWLGKTQGLKVRGI